ncbi:MAG: hypothetical protein PHZ00_07185, partial [Candidatus Peribacteraceae bacterium]|nr:hypothetical protein [Candidatus Peribacteraceae bacterium]
MPRQSRRIKQRPPSGPSRSGVRRFLRDTFTFAVTVAFLLSVRTLTAPVIGSATYVASDQAPVTADMPFFIPSVASEMRISVPIEVAPLHPYVFSVQVDDCIERLIVNGQRVIPERHQAFCSPHDKTRINLGRWLVPGANTLVMEVSDIGVTGGLDIGVSPIDPLMFFITI